ncbi:ABC transporter permease [Jeotgalibaca caeni]|uniref:ABC transporter permease n=1 Tax=Jeotgalibaca caeni TaxID=3028623 RepID=UPI00237DC4FB|nr:ABC transporter permease [Jeotgalibaca caeni]MDE1549641.1 ABC transporter permease [Jeotgalibaca caeni]
MNVLEQLANRRKKYFKKMSRYAKYVFNDHFVIVIIFLFGALAYQYAEFLKTVEPPFHIGKWIWALVLSGSLFIGKLATLVQAADPVFLAAKEKEWQHYLKNTKSSSLLFPAFLLFILAGVAFPMLFVGQPFRVLEFLLFYVSLLLLKWTELGIQEEGFYFQTEPEKKRALLFVLSFVVLMIGFLMQTWISLLLSVVVMVLFQRLQKLEVPLLHWEKVVHQEEKRSAQLNRLINLFTDIPTVRNPAKRRKYLDQAVTFLSGKDNPYQYLYARAFVRGSNYSGLYFRLTGIGVLIFIFTTIPLVSLLLNVLFIYLTGFQLSALYGQMDEHLLARLYPAPKIKKEKGFEHLLLQLLVGQSLAFAVATVVGSGPVIAIGALFLNVLFSLLFIRFYLVKRVQKRAHLNL